MKISRKGGTVCFNGVIVGGRISFAIDIINSVKNFTGGSSYMVTAHGFEMSIQRGGILTSIPLLVDVGKTKNDDLVAYVKEVSSIISEAFVEKSMCDFSVEI